MTPITTERKSETVWQYCFLSCRSGLPVHYRQLGEFNTWHNPSACVMLFVVHLSQSLQTLCGTSIHMLIYMHICIWGCRSHKAWQPYICCESSILYHQKHHASTTCYHNNTVIELIYWFISYLKLRDGSLYPQLHSQ